MTTQSLLLGMSQDLRWLQHDNFLNNIKIFFIPFLFLQANGENGVKSGSDSGDEKDRKKKKRLVGLSQGFSQANNQKFINVDKIWMLIIRFF